MPGSTKSLLAIALSLGLAACGGVTETDDGDAADDGATVDDGAGVDGGDPSGDDGGDPSDDGVGGLTIESVTPDDGATDASKTDPVVIVFSGEIEPASVTDETIEVRAGGVPVAGVFEVSGAEVSFTPDVQWHLRAAIDVVVTTDVTGPDDATLSEAAAIAFRVEDGAWQEPALIASGVACCSQAQSNLRGDIVFPFPTADDSISVVTFDAATQTFRAAVPLETDDRAFDGPIAALDESGNAIVAWRGLLNSTPEIIGWSRFVDGEWSVGRTQEIDNLINQIGLGDDGTALALWGEAGDVVGARLGPAASGWTQPVVLEPGASSWGARDVGGQVQVVLERGGDGLFSRTLDPESGELGDPAPIGAAGADVNYVNHVVLEDGGAIFSWWQPDDGEIRFGRFDPETGAWSDGRLGDGQGGSGVCENASGSRIGTFQTAGGTVLAAAAAPGQGFGLPDDLGSQTGLEYAGCFLDRFGNGHGLWAGYGTDRVFWSRYHADGSWDPAIEVVETPAMRGWSSDIYGNLTIVYADGTDLYARRFR